MFARRYNVISTRYFRSAPLLAALICLLLVAACSALRIGYLHADTLLAWRADDYFDLEPQQKQEFDARLERLLVWHRYEQLPEYATFLDAAINKAQSGLKREDVVWFIDGIKARYRTIVNRGIVDAAEMLATLTPEQIVALQKRLDKDNRKYAKENELGASLEKRKRARLKKTLKRIMDWTGSITWQQEQEIAALLDAVPLTEHLRYPDRIRRQQELLQLLELRNRPQEFQPRLLTWLTEWERGRAPEFQELSREADEKWIQFYLEVDRLLTPGQRQVVLHRLRDYADDCRSLSERRQRTANVQPIVSQLYNRASGYSPANLLQ